ncbi:MAG: hypothetical protein ACRCS8_03615 [Brevinema sp.]
MNHSEKAMLHRRANELFQNKDYKNALKIYMAISDNEGIGKIANVLEKEKKDRVAALKLYKRAGMIDNVDRLAYEMAQTVRFLIKEDQRKEALESGKDFNEGFKISGQAPTMLPHEAVAIAKEKLGISPARPAFSPAEADGRVVRWKPMEISREEINKFNKNK